MRLPTTLTLTGATPRTIPGLKDRRVNVHKISAPGATLVTVTEGSTGNTLWSSDAKSELFHVPLRATRSYDGTTANLGDVIVTATGATSVSVQYSYEG